MNIIKNKTGIGLPVILGIILFVVTSTIILVTSIYGQSLALQADFKNHEEYLNAKSSILAADNIIVRDQSLDSTYLDQLSTHLGVDISQYSDEIYLISKTLSNDRVVKSYLMGTPSGSISLNLKDSLFQYSGIEPDFTLNPFITPAVILSGYLDNFMATTFPTLNYNESFNNFADIFTYFSTLAADGTYYQSVSPNILADQTDPTVNGHWYVDGNRNIANYKNLTIPDGYLLIVNGNLQMGKDSTIYGNLVVNGTVSFNSAKNDATLLGTIYCSGSVSGSDNLYLGTAQRPSFIFTDSDISLKIKVIGYGYFMSQSFSVQSRKTTINITGGIYSPSISNIDSTELQAYSSLDEAQFYSYGIPQTVSIDSGGSSGSVYIFTYPA